MNSLRNDIELLKQEEIQKRSKNELERQEMFNNNKLNFEKYEKYNPMESLENQLFQDKNCSEPIKNGLVQYLPIKHGNYIFVFYDPWVVGEKAYCRLRVRQLTASGHVVNVTISCPEDDYPLMNSTKSIDDFGQIEYMKYAIEKYIKKTKKMQQNYNPDQICCLIS